MSNIRNLDDIIATFEPMAQSDRLDHINTGFGLLRTELNRNLPVTEIDHMYYCYLLSELVRNIEQYYGRDSVA